MITCYAVYGQNSFTPSVSCPRSLASRSWTFSFSLYTRHLAPAAGVWYNISILNHSFQFIVAVKRTIQHSSCTLTYEPSLTIPYQLTLCIRWVVSSALTMTIAVPTIWKAEQTSASLYGSTLTVPADAKARLCSASPAETRTSRLFTEPTARSDYGSYTITPNSSFSSS